MPRLPSFWTSVTAVWAGLKLKEQWDSSRQYAALDNDERNAEGGIRLPTSARLGGDETAESLLGETTTRRKKKPGCCMCCGMDCTLFWKAFGIVVGLWVLYGAFSGVKWILTPSPTGLEGMPVFSTSLGCEGNNFFYKDSPNGVPYTVPVSEEFHDHSLKLTGSGVGTITVKNAPAGVKDVVYNIVLHGTDREVIDTSEIEIESPSSGEGTSLLFNTPKIPLSETSRCVRFDLIMSVPSSLEVLKIGARAVSQVKFDADLDLKKLSVILFKLDEKNMILPTEKVFADTINFEVFQGWIVGETTISKSTEITTQRSNGVAHLKVHPAKPEDPLRLDTASLRTTTGSGRTDITYIANPTKRPIDSVHLSQKNGDVYLNYKQARYNGKIAMKSKSYSMTGTLPIAGGGDSIGGRADEPEWTHTAGDSDGDDRIEVSSRGWTGLYF